MTEWTVQTKDLTEVERRLVDAVDAGEALRLDPDYTVGFGSSHTVGPERVIRSAVIRDILRGRHTTNPDPQGIQLIGAYIPDQLDLDHVRATLPLRLERCDLPNGARMIGTHLPMLDLSCSTLANPEGPALAADGLTVDTNTILKGLRVVAAGASSAVRLPAAHVGGVLDLANARVCNPNGPALIAERLVVDGYTNLTEVVLRGTRGSAAVGLQAAHIGFMLDLGDATITNPHGPALHADQLVVDGLLSMRGATFRGTGELGTVRLPDAHIRNQLNLTHATIINPAGPSLHAESLSVDGMASLSESTFEGSGTGGAVCLSGAYVGDQLDFLKTRITNQTGPALVAERITVNSGTRLHGATFVGSDTGGAVCLADANVLGQLDLREVEITNQTGPALTADRVNVGGSTNLSDATIDGVGRLGAVRLPGANVGGQLNLGGKITNPTGPALMAERLTVGDVSYMEGATFDSPDQPVAVRLASARLATVSVSTKLLREAQRRAGRWQIDGMTYTGHPVGVSHAQWLTFLQNGTSDYAAQPYQHLAAVDRAAGHDEDARRSLMTQRRDQLARAGLGRWSRSWRWFTGVSLGFGYQPWRALIGLALVVVIAVGGCLATPNGLETSATTNPIKVGATDCSWPDRVEYAFNATIPLVATDPICRPTATTTGIAVRATGWILSLLAALALALFIAGFTNAVRKP